MGAPSAAATAATVPRPRRSSPPFHRSCHRCGRIGLHYSLFGYGEGHCIDLGSRSGRGEGPSHHHAVQSHGRGHYIPTALTGSSVPQANSSQQADHAGVRTRAVRAREAKLECVLHPAASPARRLVATPR